MIKAVTKVGNSRGIILDAAILELAGMTTPMLALNDLPADSWQDVQRQVENLTPEDLERCADAYVDPARMVWVMIRPRKREVLKRPKMIPQRRSGRPRSSCPQPPWRRVTRRGSATPAALSFAPGWTTPSGPRGGPSYCARTTIAWLLSPP